MTDEEKLKAQQLEFIKKLQAIGSDLWGGAAGASSGTEAEGGAEQASHPDQPSENGKQSLPKKNKVQTRPEIGIENLWMTADETIDWTDALAYERPNDGLTAPGLWQYYHRMAEKVLSGDIQAYAEVLRKMNPLGDLTGYADGLTMRAPDAERLEGQFTCRADYLEKNGTGYLAAMGLRIARDLLACLPVSEVGVTAYNDGELVMDVTYPREALRHINFQYADPEKLALQCGGIFRTGEGD